MLAFSLGKSSPAPPKDAVEFAVPNPIMLTWQTLESDFGQEEDLVAHMQNSYINVI